MSNKEGQPKSRFTAKDWNDCKLEDSYIDDRGEKHVFESILPCQIKTAKGQVLIAHINREMSQVNIPFGWWGAVFGGHKNLRWALLEEAKNKQNIELLGSQNSDFDRIPVIISDEEKVKAQEQGFEVSCFRGVLSEISISQYFPDRLISIPTKGVVKLVADFEQAFPGWSVEPVKLKLS